MFESGTESSNMFAIGGNVKLRSYNTSTKYEPLDVIYEAQQEVRYLSEFWKNKIKTRDCMCIYSVLFFLLLKLILMKFFFFWKISVFSHILEEKEWILNLIVFKLIKLFLWWRWKTKKKRYRKSFLLHFCLDFDLILYCYVFTKFVLYLFQVNMGQ